MIVGTEYCRFEGNTRGAFGEAGRCTERPNGPAGGPGACGWDGWLQPMAQLNSRGTDAMRYGGCTFNPDRPQFAW